MRRLFEVMILSVALLGLVLFFLTPPPGRQDGSALRGDRSRPAGGGAGSAAGTGEERPEKGLGPGEDAPPTAHRIQQRAGIGREERAPGRIPGEWIVRFASQADLEAFLARAAALGLVAVDRLDGLLAVRVRGSRAQLEAALAGSTGPFELAGNFRISAPDRPPPPPDVDVDSLQPFGDTAPEWLGADPACPGQGSGVTVAVLDTGIRPHPTLASARIRSLDLLGDQAAAAGDYAGHGSAIASLIAGSHPLAPGMAPQAEILDIRVLDANGVGDVFTLAKGITAAADAGAQIINLSLGGYGYPPVLQEAIRYASAQGALVVAAAGNDGGSAVLYPARSPEVVAVGAVDAKGAHVPYSNQGQDLDLVAPGFGVNAAWVEDQLVLFSGTSAATALVSGLAAVLLSRGQTDLTPEGLADLLVEISRDAGEPGRDDRFGAGIPALPPCPW
ncbi:MAG: S8 family serine peptidase [Thermodesulfobacteriota bacterium]